MKQSLKLNKSIAAILLMVILCSNASYSQGLLGKIKKGLAAVNKVTNVVKNPTDAVSVVTGKGTGKSTGGNTVGDTTTKRSYFYISQTNETTGEVPLSNEDLIKRLTLVNRTGRTIVVELIVKR